MELPKEEWWVEGAVLQSDTETRIVTSYFSSGEIEEGIMAASYLVGSETVCEYTGLTDKNGRKIFGGDIIEVCTFGFNPERFVTDVIYDKCAFRLKNGRSMFYCGQSDFTKMDDAKVIGNIFDNLELLEGGKSE